MDRNRCGGIYRCDGHRSDLKPELGAESGHGLGRHRLDTQSRVDAASRHSAVARHLRDTRRSLALRSPYLPTSHRHARRSGFRRSGARIQRGGRAVSRHWLVERAGRRHGGGGVAAASRYPRADARTKAHRVRHGCRITARGQHCAPEPGKQRHFIREENPSAGLAGKNKASRAMLVWVSGWLTILVMLLFVIYMHRVFVQ